MQVNCFIWCSIEETMIIPLLPGETGSPGQWSFSLHWAPSSGINKSNSDQVQSLQLQNLPPALYATPLMHRGCLHYFNSSEWQRPDKLRNAIRAHLGHYCGFAVSYIPHSICSLSTLPPHPLYFPQSLRYIHTHLVADNNTYFIRCEQCSINSLHLVYFHHKTISPSPSCYKLKSSLTVLLKLLSQKPLMTWLPSPITSQSSSLFLYSSDSQPWLQIRSTKKILVPGPHPGANLIGLGLAEGCVIA